MPYPRNRARGEQSFSEGDMSEKLRGVNGSLMPGGLGGPDSIEATDTIELENGSVVVRGLNRRTGRNCLILDFDALNGCSHEVDSVRAAVQQRRLQAIMSDYGLPPDSSE